MFVEVYPTDLASKNCRRFHKEVPKTLLKIKAIHCKPLKIDLQDIQIMILDGAGRKHRSRRALWSVVHQGQ